MRCLIVSSVLWLAVGCGQVESNFADAAAPPEVDGSAGPVVGPATITVRRELSESGAGQPIANVQVFFIRPDGTSEMKETGDDGHATADVVAGSTIVTTH